MDDACVLPRDINCQMHVKSESDHESLPPPEPALASESFLSQPYMESKTSPFKLARQEQRNSQVDEDPHVNFPRRRLMSEIDYHFDEEDAMTCSLLSSCSSASLSVMKPAIAEKWRRLDDESVQVCNLCISCIMHFLVVATNLLILSMSMRNALVVEQ